MVDAAAFTRRGLMGAGLALSAGGILLPEASLAASKPKRGGRIRVACISSSTADTLDPAKASLSTDYVRHYMVYNGLTVMDRHMVPRLSLAESITSRDQKYWHIRLRKGITFHNGKNLDARDVVYSLLRHKKPETASKLAQVAAQFAEIKAISKYELTILLTGANADLPAILAQSHFLIIAAGTTDFRTANGTGPYRITKFTPGVRTIGTRNENYWKPGKPYLDEIELIGIPDVVGRVNALLSGDVQLVNALDPGATRRVRASGRHAILDTPSGLYTNLIMRQDMAPTSNQHFTMALKYLFDRELIKRALFRNYATIGNDQPIPPFHPYYRADLPQRTLDLDRAKWHLQKSGLSGTRLPVYASPAATGSVDMASILQEYGSRIGLNLAVNRVPGDGYWSMHWMKHPLGFGNTNPRPTADLVFSQFYQSSAEWNESGWKNPKFDRLLVEARAESNQARRKQLYGEMQGLVHDRCGVAIPVFMNLLDGYDKRLRGLFPVPLGGLMGYNFSEHAWWEG